ncbi:MAG: 16S rRNA (uracil(1498)-N(3))-methyltransferase, partial [Muribaculaceae bacterium]|nr:16S rRNA (uracil(1498)-N(3))-methyltransferase [Muribaculaceae bacterium]
MIRFYAPDIADTLTLPESDSGHCVRVLRMHTGDSIEVVDGAGTLYRCKLRDAHQRHATVDITESVTLPRCGV